MYNTSEINQHTLQKDVSEINDTICPKLKSDADCSTPIITTKVEQAEISEFSSGQHNHEPLGRFPIDTIVERIRTGEYIKPNPLNYWEGMSKKCTVMLTWSGPFYPTRIREHLTKYSGLINVRFKRLTKEQFSTLWSALTADIYTHVLIKGESGRALTIVVKTDGYQPDDHVINFKKVVDYYGSRFSLLPKKICMHGINMCQLYTPPHDPDVFYNPDSAPILISDSVKISTAKEDRVIQAVTEFNRIESKTAKD